MTIPPRRTLRNLARFCQPYFKCCAVARSTERGGIPRPQPKPYTPRFSGPALASAPALSAATLSAAAGIKPGDLPDLTIKEVKAHVTTDDGDGLACVVTQSGIEGNYTLRRRYWHPNWSNQGWVEFSKQVLIGKNALDRASLTSQWAPVERRRGQSSYATAIDNCLWDILGKAVGLPVYQILAPTGTACSPMQALSICIPWRSLWSRFAKCKAEGFKAYKITPSATALRRLERLQTGYGGLQGRAPGRGRRLHPDDGFGRKL